LQFGNGIKNLPFGSLLVACTLLRGSAPCHRSSQARSPGQASEWRVAERATLLQDSAPVKSHEGCRRARGSASCIPPQLACRSCLPDSAPLAGGSHCFAPLSACPKPYALELAGLEFTNPWARSGYQERRALWLFLHGSNLRVGRGPTL